MRVTYSLEMPLLVEITVEGIDEEQCLDRLGNTLTEIEVVYHHPTLDNLDCQALSHWFGDTVIHSTDILEDEE